MRTLLVTTDDVLLPMELRRIIDAGSTAVEETRSPDRAARAHDRILTWGQGALQVGDRRLHWPDDEEEIRLLLQTGG